jgi:hypothetical protein
MQTLQTWCTLDSACHWPLGVVCGPAHGPRADVVELAAGARPPVIVAFPQRKELPLPKVGQFGLKVLENRMLRDVGTVFRQIASLTAQCRQVYCLVEMAPSAPSWRPPRNGVSSTASQAGENDQTNVATQQSFQAFSTHPTLRRSRRRRTAPSDPSLIQPSG